LKAGEIVVETGISSEVSWMRHMAGDMLVENGFRVDLPLKTLLEEDGIEK